MQYLYACLYPPIPCGETLVIRTFIRIFCQILITSLSFPSLRCQPARNMADFLWCSIKDVAGGLVGGSGHPLHHPPPHPHPSGSGSGGGGVHLNPHHNVESGGVGSNLTSSSNCFDKDGLELALKFFLSSTLTMRLTGIGQINAQINAFNEMCNTESVVEVEKVGLQLAGKCGRPEISEVPLKNWSKFVMS